MQPLLFGPEGVRSIARRPFFASVLARRKGDGHGSGNAPNPRQTLFGTGGRAVATTRQGGQCCCGNRLCLTSRRSGSSSLGKKHKREIAEISNTVERLTELSDDGIVRSTVTRTRHSRSTHDIFFEWSYFRLLLGLREDWITALVEAGQPPLLGRVVGLLAQRRDEVRRSMEGWADATRQTNFAAAVATRLGDWPDGESGIPRGQCSVHINDGSG